MKSTNVELWIIAISTILFYRPEVNGQIMIGETPVDTHSIITNIDTPWEILWGPDNYIWFTERPGRVNRLNPETGEKELLLTLSDVHEESESGLLGMALHPLFPEISYVYLVYNYYSGGIRERIVRYTFNGSALINPDTLLENIGGSRNHNGSRMIIGADNKLYISTGDATNTSTSQNLSSINGKILRLNLDGSIPEDNPFTDSYIWSFGHRNPQGIVLSNSGIMYSSEHGPDEDDELNLIEKGRNYGWPDIHGFCDDVSEIDFCNENNVFEPLFAWTPTLAVAGIDYYAHDAILEWKNSILITTLKEQDLRSLVLSEDGRSIVNETVYFNNRFGRLRDICVSPDGWVYIATSNHDGRGNPVTGDDRIIEIRPSGISGGRDDEFVNPESITICPNPIINNGVICFNDRLKDGILYIYNLTGTLVLTDYLAENTYTLVKNDFQPGCYVIFLKKDDYSGAGYFIVI